MGDETVIDDGEAAPHSGHPLAMKVAKGIVYALIGLVALALIVVFGLNTDPGRRFVTDQIENLAFENGMKIGIGRIDGSLYGEMTIRDLTLSDPKGVFLTAPVVAVDWRPFAFAKNHVDIRSATAELMTLRRLPEFAETPPSDAPLLPDLDIDIGRLKVARLVLEAPVTGERRVASLDAKVAIADRRAQVTANAATIGDGASGDRLKLVLDAVPEKNRLALDLALDAPGDGVVAKLAGLTEPLKLRLTGKGDWQAWNGRLDANLAGKQFARLTLGARDGTFSVKGDTRVARLLSGPTAALLGPVTTIDLTTTFENRRADLSGRFGSDAFRLAANGLVDLGENSFSDLKLAFVLLKPGAIAPNLSGSGLRAALTLDGKFAKPSVDYDLTAARIAFNDIVVESLTASGKARVDADAIIVPVAARARRIGGLDTVAGGTLVNVRLDGDLAIDGPRILSDNMRIRSDRIDATAILLADTSTGLYTGAIDGKVDNYRIESVGIFNIETEADLKTAANGGFTLVGKVRARSTQLFNSGVRDFLGGNAVASSDLVYGTDGTIRFSNLRLTAPALRVTGGKGSYSADGRIDLTANAISTQYGPLGVRLAGTVTSPHAIVTADKPGFGIGLAGLTADIRGDGRGYRVDAKGATDYGPFTADLLVLTASGPLTIEINRADFAGIGLTGRVQQSAAGPFTGRLDAKGRGLGGTVRLGAEGRYQAAAINLRANDTVLPGPANLAIGSAIVDASVILYDRPQVLADIQLAQTRYGAFDFAVARAKIDYRDGRGKAQILAEGSNGVPFRVAANADLTPQLWRAAIKGRANGIDFRTTSPARIVPGKNAYELLPTRIDFGRGNIRFAGKYGDGLTIQSRLDSLDLGIANALVPGLGLGGRASGSLDFAQANPSAFPRADARLTVTDFTRTTAVSVSQPVNVNFAGKLLASGGEARAVIRRRGSVIGRLQASLSPLPPGSGSWVTRMMEAPLGGGIRYNGPADTLFSFAGQPDQRLSGPIGLAADFSCRVSKPCLNGVVRAKSLTYENQTYGTRLTNMAINGRFDDDRFELTSLKATAGNGTVSGQGTVSLSSDNGYPMDVRLDLANARLARSENISASATGDIRLQKIAGQTALLSGDIRLPETRYKVIRQGAARVPELAGVRFKPPQGRQRVTGDRNAAASGGIFDQLRLDIRLRAPDQLYVSGMGLESEWQADFTVAGTTAAPRVSGEVELVRGTLGFAGRSFDLESGRVAFTGGSLTDPTIALVATDSIEGVTVNVNVSGRATNPQIAFSSVPGLPQDEIVSRILFGSSVTNLSPIQAVQLAASLNSLRGSGGGLNPLGKLQSATGLDRLRILGSDDTTGRGTALAAGQYITDDIYLEIITDARGFTATQLEVSLTPALSILSQAGGSGSTNVNVRYRKDY